MEKNISLHQQGSPGFSLEQHKQASCFYFKTYAIQQAAFPIQNLITNSNISLSDMGFPQNWTTEPLWM